MKQVITYWDFALLPVYLLIISKCMQYYRLKVLHLSKEMATYFTWAFRVKMLFAVIFVLLTQYFFGKGDTIMYYEEGVQLNKYITENPANLKYLFAPAEDYWNYKMSKGNYEHEGYIEHEANFMPMRIVAFFSFFTFRNFTITTLFFSILSFLGLWKLFEAFAPLYPNIKRKLALACLFIPSVVFWSSAILKDTLCIMCIGFLIHGIFYLMFKKFSAKEFGYLVLFGTLLLITKYYIALALLPAIFILWILKIRASITNMLIKQILIPLVLVLIVILVYAFTLQLESKMEEMTTDVISETIAEKRKNFEGVQDRGEGRSFFELGEVDLSLKGLLKISPKVINAVFFRPYFWDSSSPIMFLSAFESTIFMLFFLYTLFRAGPVGFFIALFKDKVLLFCLVFCLAFGFIVGITTPNFGSLVRYKIPCIPFFCILLIGINAHALLKKAGN
ncbi:MAG: hypothetical protein IPP11_01635 [Chitinophagaceae bacterium]|nr:hypothetical protein [Chitinophagaceae bacterium]